LVLCDEARISWHHENSIVSWSSFLIYSLSLSLGVAKLSSVNCSEKQQEEFGKTPSERLYTPTENGTPEEESRPLRKIVKYA
jgi:hypothetical protein